MSASLRGLQVLEALAGMRQPATLKDIAQRLELSEPYVFRLLRTLEMEGYLHHLGRTGYRLGERSVALAVLIGPRPALLRLLYPAVSSLAATAGEAVVVHLRAGRSRVLVLGVPAPSGPILDPAGVLGERSPLASGASGRVILSQLPPTELAQMHLPAEIEDNLGAIRSRGYETSLGENHPGIHGVSVALVASGDGEHPTAFGSISIAGPARRLSRHRLDELATPLQGVCLSLAPRVSAVLGPDPGRTFDAHDL